MGSFLRKLSFILLGIFFPMVAFSAATEESEDSAEQQKRSSVVPISPIYEKLPNGSYAISLQHEKLRMSEFLEVVTALSQYKVSFLDLRDSEARLVHLYNLFKVYAMNPYLDTLDLRSPLIWIDFHKADVMGLEAFLHSRRGRPFELCFRHIDPPTFHEFSRLTKERPGFPRGHKVEKSIEDVILTELVENPLFSFVLENAPPKIAFAIFRAQCKTLHGRKRLMTQIETMARIIQGKDLDRRLEGAGFRGFVQDISGGQAAAAAASSANHEAGIEAEETLRQQEAAQEGGSSLEVEEMAET